MGSDPSQDTTELDKAMEPILADPSKPGVLFVSNGESKEAKGAVWDQLVKAQNLVLLFFEQYGYTDDEIDPRVFDLPQLGSLSLGRNKLTGKLFTGENHYLHKLKDRLTLFFVDNNLIEDVPEDIWDLVKMEKLSLCNNQIRTISPKVSQLCNLDTLYLSDNQLREVPDALGDIPSLKQLYLHNNQLERIPDSFKGLTGLRTLELANNKLTEFPRVVCELQTNLAELYLGQNSIADSIPPDVESMLGLLVLDVHDNPDLQAESGLSQMLTALGVSLFLPTHLQRDARNAKVNGLHFCAEHNLAKAAKRILQRPMTDRLAVLSEENEDGRTPLSVACFNENPKMAVLFVKFGAPLEHVDHGGRTPMELIHYKALRDWEHPHPFFNTKLATMFKDRGQSSIDEYIIVTDACVNWANYGTYGFDHEVAKVYHDELDKACNVFTAAASLAVAKLVTKRDSAIASRRAKYNLITHTRLNEWIAILESARDLVRHLSDEGEQKSRNRQYDPLTLHIMAVKGITEAVRPLMERGAEINLRNSSGKTALHLAAEYGQLDMIRELVSEARRTSGLAVKKQGSEATDLQVDEDEPDVVHLRDHSGHTPLHYAVTRGHVDCVQQLLEFDAVPEFDTRPAILRMLRPPKAAKTAPSSTEPERPQDIHRTALEVLNAENAILDEMNKKVENRVITESSAQYQRAVNGVRVAEKLVETVTENKYVRGVRDDFAMNKFLWSFVPYLFFLIMLFFIGRHGTSADLKTFPFKSNLADRITDEEFEQTDAHIRKTFGDIGGVEDFWAFVDGPLSNFLYPTEDGAGNPLVGGDSFFADGRHNRVLGQVRFRQLRMANGSCSIPDEFKDYVSRCHGFYEKGKDDESPFGPSSAPAKYTYRKAKGQVVLGQFWNQYPGSGYIVDVPSARVPGLAKIAELKADNWIDSSTSVVFIEMTHYNGNINRLAYGRLVVEFPSSGGAFSSNMFRSLKPKLYDGSGDIVILVLEVVCALMVTAYFLDEIREMLEDGFAAYFEDFWNYFDLTTTIGFMAIFVLKMLGVAERDNLTIPPRPEEFLNLSTLATLTTLESNIIALVFMLSILKTSKFMTYIPGVGPLTLAVVGTVLDRRVIVFLVFLSVVLTSFSMGVYFAFGNDDAAYFTVGHSFLTMVRGLFGDLETDNLNSPFRVLYFLIILVVAVLVLMNLFIAVISEVYAELYEQNNEAWNEWLTETMAENVRETTEDAPAITKIHFFNYFYRKKKDRKDHKDRDSRRVVPMETLVAQENMEAGTRPLIAEDGTNAAGGDTNPESESTGGDGKFAAPMVQDKAVRKFLEDEKESGLENFHLFRAVADLQDTVRHGGDKAGAIVPHGGGDSGGDGLARGGSSSALVDAGGVARVESQLRAQETRIARTEDMLRELLTLVREQRAQQAAAAAPPPLAED